jgi:glucose-6-phosphate isomerase
MQTKSKKEAEAYAAGALVVAADEVKKLEMLLRRFQELVHGRISPTALIGIPMAEAIEHHAMEIVGAIREAARHLQEAQ